MKILISDKLSPEGLAELKKSPELQLVEAPGQPRADILRLIADADALIVRSETQADKELIAAGKKLKAIGRAGVGVDNIDLQAAAERGIVVMNAPEGNTIATCELTFAHILNSFRPLANAAASMRAGQWDKKSFMGVELHGKTLGILGCGRIGAQVAKRALAFGMRVLAYDPYLTPERAKELGVGKVELEMLLITSHVITLHLPLTPDTEFILDDEAFNKTRKGVRIVNVARGQLIHEGALIRALEKGHVGYAGLDVYLQEPLPADHPLRKFPQVTLTPHLGASTVEAQAAVGVEIAQNISNFLLKGQKRSVCLPL